VIGVAGGKLKIPAIRAALCGKLVNVLATDSAAAEGLVED
jgi:DNA-binding transcriptional regulator LsrR (DeoR family)